MSKINSACPRSSRGAPESWTLNGPESGSASSADTIISLQSALHPSQFTPTAVAALATRTVAYGINLVRFGSTVMMSAASTPAKKRIRLTDDAQAIPPATPATLALPEASGSVEPSPSKAPNKTLPDIDAASMLGAPQLDASTSDSATSPLPTSQTRTPYSAKGKDKGKVKAEADDDYDNNQYGEVEQVREERDGDLEVLTHSGPLSTLQRVQIKTAKPRSIRPAWMQGVFQPPFFGIPPADLAGSVWNGDHDPPSEDSRTQAGLPWPRDGHAQTWLDPLAYPKLKKSLVNFWTAQPGWIPREGVYDWGWYPGKPIGYAQSRERAVWAARAREQLRMGADASAELIAHGDRAGWPFVQPWLDPPAAGLVTLSSEDAAPYVRGPRTPQREQLQHPTTVMKLAVPELSMRSRLKGSLVRETPRPKPKSEAPVDDDDDDDDEGADDTAAMDANQQPIDASDARFGGIANLGFTEAAPVCGEELEVCVGATGRETPVRIARGAARRLDGLGVVPDEGHVLNVGGHVYALDWAPVPLHLGTGREFFAVSAGCGTPLSCVGAKTPRPCPASLQVWSVAPDTADGGKGEARLEMVVCHEAGTAFKLAWCPMGHAFVERARLGLLAGCFGDGSVSVFAVPHPASLARGEGAGPVHVRLDPVVRLETQEAATSLAWAGGERLALGAARGWIGVWNVGSVLRSTEAPLDGVVPEYVVRAHRSAVVDMTFVLLPPIDVDGRARESASPTMLFSVGLDGCTVLLDTRAGPVVVERSRTVHYACAWAGFSGSLVHEHADGSVNHYSLRPEEMLRSRLLSYAPARALALATSTFHPMVAIGSAHGQVKVTNSLRTFRRTARVHLPIYQTVLDRKTGRMTLKHHLVPESANHAEQKRWHIAQWHPALAVTALRWNPNFHRAQLLISGTAAGMVKIDCVAPPT